MSATRSRSIVAETPAQARDAAELIEIDYETLPSVVETATALAAGQPAVWPAVNNEQPGNLCFDWEIGDRAAVERAAASARHRVSLTLVNNRVVANSMEPRGAVGEYDPGEDSYTLWSSTQGSHFLRNLLAEHVFHVPENRIRVVTPDVGGGFGMKLFLYPEHVLVLWAAKRLGRPVKWVADRSEAFVTDTQGRDNVAKLDLALDDQYRFLGLSVELIANMGAYLSNFAPEIPTASGGVMYSGVYAFPAIHVAVKGVYTNTVPVDAYRGAGRPEAAYAVERLIDYAARRLGIDADELRRRNFIKPAAMPYATPLGLTYDSGDFARNLDDALAAADAAGFPARKAEARRRGRLRGLGHAVYIEQSGFPPDEFAEARFDPSGTLTLLMGTQSSGQGHQTAYAQLAAEKLGLPLDKIRVLQGDTEAIGFGRGTGGSRSIPVGGAALFHAADKLIAKGKKIAAHMLEAAEADIAFDDGAFSIAGTDRGVHARRGRARRLQPRPIAARSRARFRRERPFHAAGADFSERVPRLRGRGRSRDRADRDRALSGGRRFRRRHQPAAVGGTGAWRDRAGGRPGDARTHRIRPGERPAAYRQSDRLRRAACRHAAAHRILL